MQTERQTRLTCDAPHIHRWGVILAGGDGKRLLPLTQRIAGDDRPKQFCTLMGRETLLSQTRSRVSRIVRPQQTLLALTKTHERFYTHDVVTVSPANLLVQPHNKGTAPAVTYSLMRVREVDPDALVAFFPSDHYFANVEALIAHLELAFAMAESHAEVVILLGITPEEPDVGYGWIEPGSVLSNALPGWVRRVSRFWEKPAQALALTLTESGCLWNSFIMVGHVRAFVNLIRRALPKLLAAFESVGPAFGTTESRDRLCDLYSGISPTDFSRDVLSVRPSDLAVLCGFGLGWSDLGEPRRVLSVLERNGVEA